MKQKIISASEFKARCLQLFDRVAQGEEQFLVTKHGRPCAKVVPVNSGRGRIWGSSAGDLKITGDIVHFSVADEWEANG